MRALLPFAFFLLPFALTPSAHAATPDDPFFPIMIWDHCPGDPAVVDKIKECGITVAGFVYPKDLPVIEHAGLKAIVSDPRCANYDWQHVDDATAKRNVDSLMTETKNNPAVFGYYLRDEPSASYFPGLAKVASLIHDQSPAAWPYINLFPNYANSDQLAAKDYQTYLNTFIQTCHPPILSYDNYSLLDNGALRDGYFQNLESMHAASTKHHIPFWNIVLANCHFAYAEPTPAGFRFQAYTSLAYGAKGLAYFTYFAPKVGNYRLAPVDQFGHETPTWSMLQSVNLQIRKLAPTLNHLTSTIVYHFNKEPGCGQPPPDSLVSAANSDQFMVGEFTHDADPARYLMVVNKDRTHSAPVSLTFRSPPKHVDLISPYTGEPTPFEGEQTWLAPGQGALLKIER